MTWKELDDQIDNELSSYLPEEFETVEDDPIDGDCQALQQAMEYVKASMEYADDPSAMKDLDRLAMKIQQLAKRKTGVYNWPFVLVMA